jgi:hypothetical protein
VFPVYVTVVDVWLIRHGHPTLSAEARRHPLATGVIFGLLTAHLVKAWRFDPLRLVGEWLR